jgi:OPT family oligopeptide transporter
MVSSGLVAFLAQWKTIVRAFSSFSSGGSDDALVKRTEVPISWFAAGASVGGVGVVLLAWRFFEVPPHYGVIAVLLTSVLALVACRATGETDITPGGPMGKIMQLTYGVLIPQSTTANLMTAGITSNAALASADLLNDLKSGYLLGAHPRRQFVAQFLGIFTGTIASTLCYFILIPNAQAITGVDGGDPKFACPGALQWKAVAEVFKLGLENLHPMARSGIFWGLAIGVVLQLLEVILPKWKKYLPSPTGIGLGLLLPFFYPLAFFIGAVLGELYGLLDEKNANRFVVPVASGIIAGESIMGVVVAAVNNFVLN